MSCRILIVEDDENIAKYIETCLEIGGYDSEICRNRQRAAQMAAERCYELILLDIMLPGLDGFEVLEHIRGYGIPVIFLTAVQDVANKVKELRDGAEDSIVKPFETLELLARIEVVLRRGKSREQELSHRGRDADGGCL